MTGGRSSKGRVSPRLGRPFFDRPTARVARDLLGTRLTVRRGRDRRSVRIVETEAYVRGDPASHAYRGLTRRNRSMFGAPGTLYVYRIHQVVCANLVTRPGEAVLLRAAEPVVPRSGNPSGPGRLCRALGLRLEDDGVDAAEGPRIRLTGYDRPRGAVAVGPRVGIRRAAERPLRFALIESRWVSGPKPWRGLGAISASSSRSRGGGRSPRSRTRRRRASAGGTSGARSAGR